MQTAFQSWKYLCGASTSRPSRCTLYMEYRDPWLHILTTECLRCEKLHRKQHQGEKAVVGFLSDDNFCISFFSTCITSTDFVLDVLRSSHVLFPWTIATAGIYKSECFLQSLEGEVSLHRHMASLRETHCGFWSEKAALGQVCLLNASLMYIK